jgi:hypothetical protein
MAAPQRATWHFLLIVGLSIILPTAQATNSGLPACGYQGGFGNTFILSSMVTPFSGPSLGKIYVDEPRGLMFTTWKNGVSRTSLHQTEMTLSLSAKKEAPLQHGGRCDLVAKRRIHVPFSTCLNHQSFLETLWQQRGSVPTLKYHRIKDRFIFDSTAALSLRSVPR